MSTANYSINWNANMSGAVTAISAGQLVLYTAAGYVVATSAARTGGLRTSGFALTPASTAVPVLGIQTGGFIEAASSTLGAGAASWVRCSTTGALERVTTPSGADDVVGWCEADGSVHFCPGALTVAMTSAIGGVTGTGLVKVAAGVIAAAGATLVDADVNAAAAIALSKTGVGTQVAPAQQYDTSVDTKGTVRTVEPKNIQTTDATVTTLDSFAVPTGSTLIVSAIVGAIKSDASQGAAYVRTAAFRNNAGTVAQISTTQDGGTFEDDAAWDCTIDFTGTTARIRITGKAATTIRWSLTHQRLEVIP